MAAIDTTRTFAHGASFGGRFFGTFAAIFGTLATWNDARVTRATLAKLSDRELDDIGLSRADLLKI